MGDEPYRVPRHVDDLTPDAMDALRFTIRMARRLAASFEVPPDRREVRRPRRYQRGQNVRVRHVPKWMRFDVLRRDGYRCRYCGAGVEEGAVLHVDHVIPWSMGGLTTEDNLVTACQPCNLGKMTSVA